MKTRVSQRYFEDLEEHVDRSRTMTTVRAPTESALVVHCMRSVASRRRGSPDLHLELLKSGLVRSHALAETFEEYGGTRPPALTYGRKGPAPRWLSQFHRVRDRMAPAIRRRRLRAWYAACFRELRPDLVHAHFGYVGADVAPVCAELTVPLIVSFYGVDASALLRDPAWQRPYQQLFEVASRIVVLAEVIGRRLVAAGAPANKIEVWNCLVDVNLCPYEERSHSGGPTRFITAARFVDKKGYPVMLEAMALLKRRGLHCTLTALGYGPLLGRIRELVQRFDIADRVEIIDTLTTPDFLSLYARKLREADVFVLPSTTAPNGDDEAGPALSMVMAQAAGLPVICTPWPGVEVSMIERQTGLFCRYDDAESLAVRMAELDAHREWWSTFGRAGRELATKNFDIRSQVEAMVDIYRRALARA